MLFSIENGLFKHLGAVIEIAQILLLGVLVEILASFFYK